MTAEPVTHSQDCWRDHLPCARGRIAELERRNAMLREDLQAARDELSYARRIAAAHVNGDFKETP